MDDFGLENFHKGSHRKLQREENSLISQAGYMEIMIFPLFVETEMRMLLCVGSKSKCFDGHEEKVAILFAEGLEHIVERNEFLASIKDQNQALQEERSEQQILINKLQEAQDQLLQQEKMASIGQLAAGVAHEINNPVGYVNSNINTMGNYVNDLYEVLGLYEKLEGSFAKENETISALHQLKKQIDFDFIRDDFQSLISESKEGVLRVKNIVKDLKDFSHVDEAEWQWADIEKGIKSTLNIVHNELKYTATIVEDYQPLPMVECVPSQINQIMMNLLVNAGHAIESKGTISIKTWQERESVCIEVSDTGKGIPPENISKIFNPFFTTKPVGKGTGLGLSLSYSIAERHGGEISVSSQVGVGTTFRLTLPIKQAKNKAEADAQLPS